MPQDIKSIFIKVNTKEEFEELLQSESVRDTLIAFILDTKQIWTHNTYFSCPYSAEEINENEYVIALALNDLKSDLTDIADNKTDKISSSTDNAVVRFDGTSGDIQNSGVTINDSNHLTAAKLITSGGTSSQFVKGDGSLDSNAYAGAQTSGGAANKAVSIPFGQVDSTSTSTAFTATVDGITELRDGVCVYLKNGVANSASGCTLNVNGLGAKPIHYSMAATTAITTQWGINYTMMFIYNSTRVSGGCWDMFYGYYSDTNHIGYQLRRNNSVLPASDTSRYYKIFFTSADNTKWVPASADSTNNATSARAVNQRPINPFGPIEYLSTTTSYTAGTNIPASSLWQQYNVTLGYSFNRTGAALTLTTSKPVFIKCAPQDDGGAIIDADVPYVQDLPTTEDGKIYIFLGVAYSATQVELQMVHPVYYYKNGSINLWTGTGVQTDVSKSTESNVIDIGEYDLMKINEVKGKSFVMNQMVQNGNFANTDNWSTSKGTISISNNIATTERTEVYAYGGILNYQQNLSLKNQHKYLIRFSIKESETGTVALWIGSSSAYQIGITTTDWQVINYIYTSLAEQSVRFGIRPYDNNPQTTGQTAQFKNVIIVDLTQMFGAGNEPTTVEEVETILGNEYYEYNTGEVVGNNVEKLDVTGFNIWDEEWESGNISNLNGQDSTGNLIRSKNHIPVVPSTNYYIHKESGSGSNFRIFYYDSAKNYISASGWLLKNAAFATLDSCYYIRFVSAFDGTTYNHDICINKSNTSKNGTYEPYKHSEFPLNLTELTGKVNGEGTSVTIFPDRLHGIGTAYDSLIVDDDGYARRAVKRMAKVDIGTFTWKTTSTESRFYASLPADATVYTAINNVFKETYSCDKYTKSTTLTDMTDKTTFLGNSSYMYAQDSSYSTAAAFKTAMSGVMLYYELATPIEYVLDTPVQCVVPVLKNGTVKQVPVMPDSTPMVMDVTYLRDTGGFIGGMMNKLASLEARIAALEGG